MDKTNMVSMWLDNHKNTKRAEFDKKLISTRFPILGIKISEIEKFARFLIKNQIKVQDIPIEYHESILLAGMILAFDKDNLDKKIKDLEYLLNFIDNWASCDIIVVRLKNLDDKKDYFKSLLNSDNDFYQRVGIVWLMKNDLKSNFKDVVNKLNNIKTDFYYVRMAISWCYAEAFLYDFDYMYNFLNFIKDKFILKMTLQKLLQSFRISQKQKEMLIEYKLNFVKGK